MTLKGNDIVVLPTGSGKSIVIAELANRLQQEILILQPSKEILEQNVSKLAQYVDHTEIGIYSASMNKKYLSKYTFATIGSIYKNPELFSHIPLVLIDECDLVNQKKAGSMYNSFLKAIGNPKVVGFTATPYRIVTGYHKIEGRKDEFEAAATLKLINRMQPFFWNRLLVNVNNDELTRQGFLAPIRYDIETLLTQEQMLLNKANTDFDLDSFVERLGTKERQIIDRINVAANECNSVLVFCSSVHQARKFSEITANSACVSAKTPSAEREYIIRNFKLGRIKVVFNMGVLTVGFDHPALDCIVLIRPTRSIRLYYQMVGRGVRVADNKSHCLVIDFSGNVEALGRIETIKLVKRDRWELESETGSWHNAALYSYIIKLKQKAAEQDAGDLAGDVPAPENTFLPF